MRYSKETNERQRQVRVTYNNGRHDSVFGPYHTLEEAEDMVSKAQTYAGIAEVAIEPYYA